MKVLLIICTVLLLLALIDLPIGYYTFLRIMVTIVAVAVVVMEYENRINYWVILFGIIAIIFNPLIPIYLGNKSWWAPIDLITALLFGIKSFLNKKNKNND